MYPFLPPMSYIKNHYSLFHLSSLIILLLPHRRLNLTPWRFLRLFTENMEYCQPLVFIRIKENTIVIPRMRNSQFKKVVSFKLRYIIP